MTEVHCFLEFTEIRKCCFEYKNHLITGTVLSGVFCFCMGQPRIQLKEGRLVTTFIINFGVGVAQFMTITFFLVGWFWSLAWGGLLLIHSSKLYEKAPVADRVTEWLGRQSCHETAWARVPAWLLESKA